VLHFAGTTAMNPITTFLVVALALLGIGLGWFVSPFVGAPLVVVALLTGMSLKMANTWQKFVILRAGKLRGSKVRACFRSFRSSTAWSR
jgi:hypothetical protein